MSDDLVTFLRARLDEDEAVAKGLTVWRFADAEDQARADRGTARGRWEYRAMRPDAGYGTDVGNLVEPCEVPDRGFYYVLGSIPDDGDVLRHVARHHPARELAEVAADREVIAMYERAQWVIGQGYSPLAAEVNRHVDRGFAEALMEVIKLRSAVHADHSDYRAEWQPDAIAE